MIQNANVKLKKCKACGEKFKPFNSLQKACSPKCALSMVEEKKAKDQRKENKRAKREFLENDIKWWLRADSALGKQNGGNTAYWLHRWIRLVRDKDKCCPMCEAPPESPRGGQWHACHYRSRGAAKQLRFDPDNIHKGCAHCNTRTEGDTGARFRAGLVPRIGEERLTELDNNNDKKRWTIEECREIRDHYKALCKEAGV